MPAKKKAVTKRAPDKAAVVKPAAGDTALFDRVATIHEQARSNVVRAVNSNMVLASMLYLPTEQEPREEVERERRLIEAHAETRATRSKARKDDRP
jgi:hypothetical protein